MERYSEYKDSGVQWIGEIPSHWEVSRLRYLCKITTGDKDTINRVENGIYPFYVRSPKIERINSYSYDGEAVLMAGDGVGAGKVFHYVNGKFGCHQRVYILHKISKIKGEFLYFYMQSLFKYVIEQLSAKSTVDSVRLNMLQDFYVAIPEFKEQIKILKYLKEVVKQIDTAISQQQKMIDLLNERKQIIINNAVTKGLDPNVKMKDSGVDWIGEICSSWNIFRLKHLLCGNLMYGANESAESEDPSFPRYIRITDIDENGKLKPETFRSLPPTKAEPYLLKKGDILFARSGATSGKTYLFDEDIKACFAGYLIKAQVSNKIISRYLMYYTRSGIYENWKNSIFIQATIQNIGADKYSNLRIPLPSISEQKEIINFLDSEMYKIDKVLDMHKCQISLLQERKQIIINDVVTGKVKVS